MKNTLRNYTEDSDAMLAKIAVRQKNNEQKNMCIPQFMLSLKDFKDQSESGTSPASTNSMKFKCQSSLVERRYIRKFTSEVSENFYSSDFLTPQKKSCKKSAKGNCAQTFPRNIRTKSIRDLNEDTPSDTAYDVNESYFECSKLKRCSIITSSSPSGMYFTHAKKARISCPKFRRNSNTLRGTSFMIDESSLSLKPTICNSSEKLSRDIMSMNRSLASFGKSYESPQFSHEILSDSESESVNKRIMCSLGVCKPVDQDFSSLMAKCMSRNSYPVSIKKADVEAVNDDINSLEVLLLKKYKAIEKLQSDLKLVEGENTELKSQLNCLLIDEMGN
ncbi:unnamed protein product [Moneuplotes crassus]|uniref:Uncharacterized protein n=1 Tax=Euplotes crassus TaxID=5936 RepID=A0AAD2DBX1_EUPCR|nr:unnamed protein product [Moneuplotes crassus]